MNPRSFGYSQVRLPSRGFIGCNAGLHPISRLLEPRKHLLNSASQAEARAKVSGSNDDQGVSARDPRPTYVYLLPPAFPSTRHGTKFVEDSSHEVSPVDRLRRFWILCDRTVSINLMHGPLVVCLNASYDAFGSYWRV